MTSVEKKRYDRSEKAVRDKYFQKKHNLLIFLSIQNDLGNYTTVVQVEELFGITREHAYKLLEQLEKEKDIEKGEQVAINGQEYYNYVVTEKAKEELEILSKSVSKNHISRIKIDKLDIKNETYTNDFMDRLKKIVQKFLPEGQVRTNFLHSLANEVQNFLDENSNSSLNPMRIIDPIIDF